MSQVTTHLEDVIPDPWYYSWIEWAHHRHKGKNPRAFFYRCAHPESKGKREEIANPKREQGFYRIIPVGFRMKDGQKWDPEDTIFSVGKGPLNEPIEFLDGWLMWTGKPYGTQVDFEGKLERMLADPSEPEPLDLSSARCIVLFHGQSANVAHERKVIPFYKAIMQKLSKQPTSSEHPAFLFAFDYRGFGTSTGTPTEKGLIQDGISAVNVILERLRISPRHVTLVGHSLGSAVATATYKYFVVNRFRREAGMGEIKTPPESLGGLLASAPFADAPRAIRQWREYFGIEVRPYLFGHSIYLEHHLPDKWNNIEALDEIGRESHIWDVTIAHAKDDPNIYDQNSKDMYTTLVNTQDAELAKEIKKRLKSLPPNEEKPHIESETFGDQKRASLILTPKGEHDGILLQEAVLEKMMELAYRHS